MYKMDFEKSVLIAKRKEDVIKFKKDGKFNQIKKTKTFIELVDRGIELDCIGDSCIPVTKNVDSDSKN